MASGFLKGTLILTIAGFVVKAIGSINWILLSRILGGEGIGIYCKFRAQVCRLPSQF